jgi:DnaJ-class molecular chaperone
MCKGYGVLNCTACKGTGKTLNGTICPVCHGTGEIICPACHGTGGTRCKFCGGDGYYDPEKGDKKANINESLQ